MCSVPPPPPPSDYPPLGPRQHGQSVPFPAVFLFSTRRKKNEAAAWRELVFYSFKDSWGPN